jgi:hypothetical protein
MSRVAGCVGQAQLFEHPYKTGTGAAAGADCRRSSCCEARGGCSGSPVGPHLGEGGEARHPAGGQRVNGGPLTLGHPARQLVRDRRRGRAGAVLRVWVDATRVSRSLNVEREKIEACWLLARHNKSKRWTLGSLRRVPGLQGWEARVAGSPARALAQGLVLGRVNGAVAQAWRKNVSRDSVLRKAMPLLQLYPGCASCPTAARKHADVNLVPLKQRQRFMRCNRAFS